MREIGVVPDSHEGPTYGASQIHIAPSHVPLPLQLFLHALSSFREINHNASFFSMIVFCKPLGQPQS